ncbi:22838_t:CDS:1, partial [Rhizophagus irregularis]
MRVNDVPGKEEQESQRIRTSFNVQQYSGYVLDSRILCTISYTQINV